MPWMKKWFYEINLKNIIKADSDVKHSRRDAG